MNHTPATLAAAFNDSTPIHGDRKVERNVTLHEAPDGSATIAVMSVMHNRDAKVFTGGIRIVRREPDRGTGFTATTWIPFERTHNRRLPNQPVARYSEKALAKADAENLAMLEAEPDWLNNLDLGPYKGTL
jgi:hypothetical protein